MEQAWGAKHVGLPEKASPREIAAELDEPSSRCAILALQSVDSSGPPYSLSGGPEWRPITPTGKHKRQKEAPAASGDS
jgi:hypothetical protein